MKKIAGVVIWYNPKEEFVKNIDSYIDFLGILYVYDNSDKSNFNLLKSNKNLHKIKYISKGKNEGVAYPLNEISQKCYSLEYEWLLTMDQDSYFQKDTIFNFFRNINIRNVGVLAPTYIYQPTKNLKQKIENKNVDIVITSGNLINLLIYNEVGGFDNSLFIDEVDHDYCLKLKSKNKQIIQQSDVFLIHELGEKKQKYKVNYTEHNEIRKYYIWRNKLYMAKKYKHLKKEYYLYLLKDLVKILCFEKDTVIKLKNIIRGLMDFSKNRMGKRKRDE